MPKRIFKKVDITFIELAGNHIERRYNSNNFADAIFFSLLHCPWLSWKILISDKLSMNVYYQSHDLDGFGEGIEYKEEVNE